MNHPTQTLADKVQALKRCKPLAGCRKSVEFSYPSSTNARRFGYPETGCYTVQTGKPGEVTEPAAAFLTRDEALHAARVQFPALEWFSYFAAVYPGAAACKAVHFEPDEFTLRHLERWTLLNFTDPEERAYVRDAMKAFLFNLEDDPDHTIGQGWPHVLARTRQEVAILPARLHPETQRLIHQP